VLEYPEPSYVVSDGIELAYLALGAGDHTIVRVTGLGPSLDAFPEAPTQWFERLASFARLVLFDRRGQGLSSRTFGFGTIEDRMDDIRVVMDAVDVDRAVLLADHDATCLALLFAATYPQRVTGMVLTSSAAPRTRWAPDYEIGIPDELLDRRVEWVARSWGTGRVMGMYSPARLHDDERRTARLERAICTPLMAAEHHRRAFDMDVRDALPAVQVPTLIVQGREEVVPLAFARYLAEHLGDATLLETEGHGTLDDVEAQNPIIDSVEEFITGKRAQRVVEIDRVLATVLFVDIATSTERLVELGDRRWSQLVTEFRQRIRTELERHRGREINYRGDDVLATFDGSTRAIRCAQAIAIAASSLGVEVRGGAHTGEVQLQGDDIAGIAVHTCARVCALAAPGEILVTSTLRDLVAGAGLEFDPRGTHALKGVPGTAELFAVRR
jgi:class 3 adenylate cyclase